MACELSKNQVVDRLSNTCRLSVKLSVKFNKIIVCATVDYYSSFFVVCFTFIQEEHSWGSGSRGQGPGSPSPEEGASPGGRLERTPSFTAEWEEVRRKTFCMLALYYWIL